MSQPEEYDYDEPWSMFAGEEEPWKDLDRLLAWEQKLETQIEMGDAFGCTPSTISYWLNKARDEVEVEYDDEELRCPYFDTCGNLAAGPKQGVCDVCLGLMRHNDSEDSLDVSVPQLHEEYRAEADDRQQAHEQFRERVEDSNEEE